MLFTFIPTVTDEERAERELARRRARAEIARPRRNLDPVLEPAWDRLSARFGR
jgi:hypothetical protein